MNGGHIPSADGEKAARLAYRFETMSRQPVAETADHAGQLTR